MKFQVWSEGCSSGKAKLLGEVEASSFGEAIALVQCKTGVPTALSWRDGRPFDWCCELFDNEADARRRFG